MVIFDYKNATDEELEAREQFLINEPFEDMVKRHNEILINL